MFKWLLRKLLDHNDNEEVSQFVYLCLVLLGFFGIVIDSEDNFFVEAQKPRYISVRLASDLLPLSLATLAVF